VASRGRHTRSTPQLPLATPEADPEKIIKKGKAHREGASTVEPCISDNFPSPSLEAPFSASHFPVIPSAGVSRTLNFRSVPVEFSPPGLGLEGEILVTPIPPQTVPWSRPRNLGDFPTPGFNTFNTPPPITIATTVPTPSSAPLSPTVSPVRTPSPPSSLPPNIPMAEANPPMTRMEAIIAARYAPLVLPQPLNALPTDGYLKQLPKFTGEGDITAEEHLEAFYSFTDHHVIMHADVWMRIFVHSLEGEARKWFRALPPGSINGIEALDNAFLRQWGDKKDFMYYMTEFGSLKRKEGESVSDFSKRFNKMYNKIPAEIKPSEASAKLTYASAFDPDFCLLLRERRATSLAHMQDSAVEVESNILVVDRLRNKAGRDIPRKRSEASTSSSSTAYPQVDKLTKMVKTLSAEMEKMKAEGKQTYRNPQNVDNRENFRRPNNNVPQIMLREQKKQRWG
jgi:hypothetical protein